MDGIATRCNDVAKNYEYAIKVSCHTYVTLYYFGKFIFCLDNDMMYGEKIIEKIERRTRKKITELPLIECKYEDFSGFRFCGKGFSNLLDK